MLNVLWEVVCIVPCMSVRKVVLLADKCLLDHFCMILGSLTSDSLLGELKTSILEFVHDLKVPVDHNTILYYTGSVYGINFLLES